MLYVSSAAKSCSSSSCNVPEYFKIPLTACDLRRNYDKWSLRLSRKHTTSIPWKENKTVEQVKTKSVEPHTRFALPEVNWDELNEAGAYVERGSGDLYRVPKEAIIPGGSPIIHKESTGSSRLVQVSKNPFVTTLEARLRCAQHNIDPNF